MTKEQMIVGFLRRCATIAETRFAMGLIEACSVDRLEDGSLSLSHEGEGAYFSIQCQVSLLPDTRSDFVIRSGGTLVAVVEVDDPTHWRDEGKADADRLRDLRMLSECGIPTIRVTNARAMGMDPEVAMAIIRLVAAAEARSIDAWSNAWRAAINHTENARAAEPCTSGTETIQ